MAVVLQYLVLIKNFALISYPGFFICLLTIIIGLVVSNRIEEIGRGRQFMGCLVAICGALLEYFLPIFTTRVPSVGAYIGSAMAVMIIRLVATVLAFKFFCGYKMSTWVIVLFVIVLIVYFGRTYYYSQIVYNMTELINNKNRGMEAFIKLFNSGNALDYITFITVIVPPLAVYIDAIPQSKKYKVET